MNQGGIVRRLVDRAVRRARPHWVRRRVDSVVGRFERFAPPERLRLPPTGRLAVVAPHPDDESIGCGGLIALWAGPGRSVEVVFLTEGGRGSPALRDGGLPPARREEAALALRRTRRAEAEAALRILGASALWLDGADSALHRDEERLAARLAECWAADPPDLVAAPDPEDRHPDHAVAARIVGRAAGRALAADAGVLAYEVWCPARITAVLDITAVAESKWRAIGQHRSQTATTDYVAAAMALNRYRAITGGQGTGFAEAFRQFTAARFAEAAERLRV